MTPDEFKLVFDMFKHFSMSEDQRINHYAYENMNSDVKYWVGFGSWVKRAYPDVWEAWQAIQDVGRV